jgi:hypothetical protein
MDFIVEIRDEYWCRNKRSNQADPHVLSAHADTDKRGSKRTRPSDANASGSSGTNKRQRPSNGKLCTNPYCLSPKNHSLSECIGYTGGSQGKYTDWWRGPWNIHLPPDQRCRANNIPPASHPKAANAKPAAFYVHDAQQTWTDTSSNAPPVDDKTCIQTALSNETPWQAWNILLDNEVQVATLPVLEDSMPRSDDCHHDSGATQHVFHDRSAFDTYEALAPVAVKGFGRNLTTAAVGRGTVRILGRYGDRITKIVLTNVLHIPAARSNLISSTQLNKAGVASWLDDGLATLWHQGVKIIGSSPHQGMYHLHMTIQRPDRPHLPLTSRIETPSLASCITPLAAAASPEQEGFCTA